MFRKIDDFQSQWHHEADSTRKVLASLTDASLAQAVVPGGRTLGFLGWHLTGALGTMIPGLTVDAPRRGSAVPARASDIVAAYERAAASFGEQISSWSDQRLTEPLDFFGRQIPAGLALEIVIRHQTHHRAQMTVLMRQAGVPVPGVYGPSKDEWASMGQTAPE